MIRLFLSIFLTTPLVVAVSSGRVCFKKDAFLVISTNDASHFPGFLTSSSVYIDKSELILKFANINELTSDVNVITFPRRFGKSLNLLMLRHFFEIELYANGTRVPQPLTKSYQFFTTGKHINQYGHEEFFEPAPAISDPKYERIVNRHSARYPVIHLEFKNVHFEPSTTFDEFITRFQYEITEEFERHEYLSDYLLTKKLKCDNPADCYDAELDLQIYYDGCAGELNVANLTESITFLSRLLKEYFSESVLIFVDEYDFVFTKLYLYEENYEKIANQVQDFYREFLIQIVGGSKDYYKQTFFTGVVKVILSRIYSGFNMCRFYDMFTPEINKYYGISTTEAAILFEKYAISLEMRKRVERFYDGYRFPTGHENDFAKYYNVFSLTHYLNTGDCHQIRNFWTGSGTFGRNFERRLGVPEIRELLLGTLFEKNHIEIVLGTHDYTAFTLLDLEHLRNITNADNPTVGSAEVQYLLRLLLATGYLTFDPATSTPYSPRFKIPNDEIATYISGLVHDILISYEYGALFHDIPSELHKFAFDDSTESPGLEKAVATFAERFGFKLFPHIQESHKHRATIFPPASHGTKKSGITLNEAFFSTIFRSSAFSLKKQNVFVGFEEKATKEIKNKNTSGAIDFYINDYQSKQAVVEFKYSKYPTDHLLRQGLQQARLYHTTQAEFAEYRYKFISILGSADGSIKTLASFTREDTTAPLSSSTQEE